MTAIEETAVLDQDLGGSGSERDLGIGGGFVLISAAWKRLFDAQRQHRLATTGIYAYVRHPQYVGFILVMFGFLLQWPTRET